MTPQQRSDAARKAAASRRANRMNGNGSSTGSSYSNGHTTARPTSRQTVNSYKAPQPTYRGLKLVALSALEDAFVMKLREQGISDDAREAYARYQKLKALALGPSVNTATQNEADTALRMSVIHLVKLAF